MSIIKNLMTISKEEFILKTFGKHILEILSVKLVGVFQIIILIFQFTSSRTTNVLAFMFVVRWVMEKKMFDFI